MKSRLYPAVLEGKPKGYVGAMVSRFPGLPRRRKVTGRNHRESREALADG